MDHAENRRNARWHDGWAEGSSGDGPIKWLSAWILVGPAAGTGPVEERYLMVLRRGLVIVVTTRRWQPGRLRRPFRGFRRARWGARGAGMGESRVRSSGFLRKGFPPWILHWTLWVAGQASAGSGA